MNLAANLARAQEALHAGRSARIVQRARLRPACEEDAAQMRFALEDALRTVDFADCGRLIVVRRLRLRALPPRAGPALVARALEAAWQALATHAVAATHPQAGDAQAVYFGSRFEARLAWLRTVAAGGDTAAWYWAAALPELAAAPPAGEARQAIEAVAEALLQQGEGDAVRALQDWPDAALLQLARLAPTSLNRRLLEAIAPAGRASEPQDDSAAAPAIPGAPAAPPADPAVPHAASVAAELASRLGAQPALPETALRWVAALWLAPRVPPAQLAVWARAVAAQAHRGRGDTERSALTSSRALTLQPDERAVNRPPADRARAAMDAGAAFSRHTPGPHEDAPAAPAWRMASGLRDDGHAAPRPPPGRAPYRAALPWLADARFTAHGGLLCLLNLLHALGFEAWLAVQPAAARLPFVHALLAHLLDACGAAADDPQRAWLSPGEGAASIPAIDSRALRLWRLRLRRALRRHATLDLSAVVRRRAWVAATATHIDAVFALDEVDLRLRRHGLDSDPGWVPWFGRIVAFHFVAAELLPQRAVVLGPARRDG